ncbi:DNRLRE domain-containing protein [Micromonospora sp. NPDC050495]|uniref:DNRLRE domain-containing protein n=1 Tax=Micromonospora sp. NPDC050495 TaxID=3154936 RepID=UPI0033D29274
MNRFRIAAAGAAAAVLGGLLGAPSPVLAAAPAASPAAAAVAPDAASAAAQAKRSGHRVEVASARTEWTQVFANPTGGFTAESIVRSRWAYATNNNSTNSDTSAARVGKDPSTGTLYRSYFEFSLTGLQGAQIQSAYVQLKLDHSWSCTNTPTYLYQSGPITSTPRTPWAPALTSLRATAQSHANESGGCSGSPQPDMVVNFAGTGVTGLVQSYAAAGLANVTVGLCACSAADGTGESTTDRWKKWYPDSARLVVEYL